jgi:hypothetical protein
MARRSKNEPVRAGGRHAAASVAGRGRPSRHHAGVGRMTAEVKGPDLVGTDRVAPGLTRCHETHVGPPFIAAARRCHVF